MQKTWADIAGEELDVKEVKKAWGEEVGEIHKYTVFWLLNKNVPGFRTKRKCNNKVEINGHGLLELEGDNNFSSSNRNEVIVNLQ